MITNKRSQELLMLATGKPLNKNATAEEKNSTKNLNMTIKLCMKPQRNMA